MLTFLLVSIAVCVPAWETTSTPLGGFEHWCHCSLVAASQLSWNDDWVMCTNHVHLCEYSLNVLKTAEKHCWFAHSYDIPNASEMIHHETLSPICGSFRRCILSDTIICKCSAKWFWVPPIFNIKNDMHTCPFDTEDYGCQFLLLFAQCIFPLSLCCCQ